MNRPEPRESVVTYPLYDAVKYLAFKGHGEYEWLIRLAHDIKNSCGRNSILDVDPDELVDETYFSGEELDLMRAFVKEFELTTYTKFAE